ncbi:MAG: DUF6597 domain-containing transcriptional factor [Dysgonomonas sp.]
MKDFQVIKPSERLAPYIKQYWFVRLENVLQASQRLLPFGCIALTFYRTKPVNNLSLSSSLSGQTTAYTDITYSGTIDFVSIIFEPAGAMEFFKIPMRELNNRHIRLNELNDSQILELEKRMCDTHNRQESVNLIEDFLLKRIHNSENQNYSRMSAVIHSVNNGQKDILELADTACFGYKQFKRIFAENIGINPKDYLRVNRFQKASHIMQIRPQTTLTELASECNYTDKSHLIRELREFSGYTPTEYKQLAGPYSEYHYLFRSAFLDSPTS